MHELKCWKKRGEELVADPVRVLQRDGLIALRVRRNVESEFVDPRTLSQRDIHVWLAKIPVAS
jgi:hypothetical protein